MAFADPQSITIGSAISLPRTSSERNAGQFKSADGLVLQSLLHTYGRRERHTIRIDHSKIASDPLMAGQSLAVTHSFYLVSDSPLVGFTLADKKQGIDGLLAALSASSGAKITQLLGGEN